MQHDIGRVAEWRKRKVIDRDGEKIGRFEEIYLSGGNQRPEWAAVSTGLFGLKHSIVPLHEAQEVGDEIQVPLEAAQVKDAPRIDPDGELSPEEEERLYSHYGLQRSGSGSGSGSAGGGGVAAGGGAGAGSGARETGSERGAGAGDDDADRHSEEGEADRGGDREEGGGRTRRHVVTEEVHRNVRTEEVDSDR